MKWKSLFGQEKLWGFFMINCLDWEDVISKHQLSYLMGNPPFAGARMMNAAQKEDVLHVFGFLFGKESVESNLETILASLIGYTKKNESNMTIIDLSGVPFEVLSITVSLISRMLFECSYYLKQLNGKDCRADTGLSKWAMRNCYLSIMESESMFLRIQEMVSGGTDAIKSISSRLKSELTGVRGFSESNIKNMRLFYDEWSPYVNRQPMADDSAVNGEGLLIAIRQPLAGDIDWNEFISLGFTHHMEILSKTKDISERLFYIHEYAVRTWDKYTLREYLGSGLYHKQENLPNNFSETLSDAIPSISFWE